MDNIYIRYKDKYIIWRQVGKACGTYVYMLYIEGLIMPTIFYTIRQHLRL